MIASQLVSIAEDLREEYHRFDILELLKTAINISSERPNLNNQEYTIKIDALKAKAQQILDQSVFRTYPLDTLKLLSSSEIHSILPATVAKMIVASFPKRKEAAISSAELSMYMIEAQQLLAQVSGFLNFNARLGVTAYEVPSERVALSIKIPRATFSDEMGAFEDHLQQFSHLFQSITDWRPARVNRLH